MEFNVELKNRVSYIEDTIKEHLPTITGYHKIIGQAMEYSVMAGGKRLRPMIIKEVFDICKGDNTKLVLPFMAGMEMLHTYSLVHDDLPAMDNDDYRRGRKTTHVVFGEDMGILAGDALLNYAYETAASAFDYADGSQQAAVARALRVFMNKAGIHGMIGGQTVDVINDGKPITADELDFIFRLKTGALIEASMMIGAILAGADNQVIDKLEKVGTYVGMAFQIQDDILDVTGDEQVIGKPVLSDERNNKVTYVTLYGLEKAKADVVMYTQKALDIMKELENKGSISDTDFILALFDMLINRDK